MATVARAKVQSMTVLPYGSWPSPISAADVARGGVYLFSPGLVSTAQGDEVWWVEGRPAEDGRYVLCRRDPEGKAHDVLPAPWNVRSRIQEYGGRAWSRVDAVGGPATVFCSWDDQRLYLVSDAGGEPMPLTTAPTETVRHMYAEPVAALPGTILVVRETHRDGVVSRDLVLVPTDGSAADDDTAVDVVNDQHHFYGNPRLSPDATRVAYIAWDHPHMPWDTTVLAVVELADPTRTERVLIGGTDESVLQPEWADDASLYAVSDHSGWWNLYRVSAADGYTSPLCPREEEFGQPLWELGQTTYAVLGDGRLAVAHGRGEARLSVLDPASGSLTDTGLDLDIDPEISAAGLRVVSTAGSSTAPTSVVVIDLAGAQPSVDVVRVSSTTVPDPAYLPVAEARTFAGPGGEVHAFIYPPTNPDAEAPDGELPPYVAFVHGGPTAHVSPRLSMDKAYFTSRGIGVIDVNYGGSTGYGRAYRERLREQWGIVDVDDTAAAIQALAESGEADGARLGIRGGSAGGWTTLACLVSTDVFAAGAAYCPVTDLLPFAEDTHDFESRYLDGLVGPLPESRDRYRERSPMTKLDQLRSAVILLQGDDDKIVPPSQPRAVHEALNGTGIPHAFLLFAGEQHGFRKAESIIAALEAELSFYGQVFGFEPPGVAVLPLDH